MRVKNRMEIRLRSRNRTFCFGMERVTQIADLERTKYILITNMNCTYI